jgi:hypothetical protein
LPDGLAAATSRIPGERGLARLVQHEVLRLDHEVGSGQLRQLDELGIRERRLHGPAASEHQDLADAGAQNRVDGGVGRVGGANLLVGQGQHAGHVHGHVAVPDYDGPLAGEVELQVLEVGVAVVPGHEGGSGPRARQVLARDSQAPVRLGPEGVDDAVVERHQLLVGDVAPDLDVAEEPEAGCGRDLLEGARDGLDLGVVGGDAEADEPPGRGQPLEQVELCRRLGGQKVPGSVEAGRPGTDDGDAQGHGSILSPGPVRETCLPARLRAGSRSTADECEERG